MQMPQFTNPVLDSAFFIHQNSVDVGIPSKGVSSAAKKIYESMKERQYSTSTWKTHRLNPKVADENTINWIFLVDLLNFSFWSDLDTVDGTIPHPERYAVKFDGVRYTGYWSLCACVNRALQAGIPITSPRYYGYDASDDDLSAVFRSDTQEQIPLLEDRIRVMREAGRVLCEVSTTHVVCIKELECRVVCHEELASLVIYGVERYRTIIRSFAQKFDGNFSNCIRESKQSAMQLIDMVVREFESFKDEHLFLGRQVREKCFVNRRISRFAIRNKRACFEGDSFGKFDDIDEVTMFADYRVPLALYHLSALSYSQRLLDLLHARTPLASSSPEEIEIRGNSIWAVELIRQEIQQIIDDEHVAEGSHRQKMKVNAILLDFYIWDHAKEIQGKNGTVPAHRTRSIYY
ncbi:hypothetical protein BC938DRAFT_481463 [Jimgerdemannia flammicorona]|uniref:Queuosine 5'-phosphate N-glycosylase/hydrolase n=1 Tax=Jimgerdemannia flammicorona TaxID=994334 RepID=A0A433QG63_9FUNG|nr:hypothetical protein BC938DRAFT_481463 [Jimgerdemannia flammicorona]